MFEFFSKYNAFPAIAHIAGLGWEYAIPRVSNLERMAHKRLSKLRIGSSLQWNKHSKDAKNTIKVQLGSLRQLLEHAPRALGSFTFGRPQASLLPQILDKPSLSEIKDTETK